jgi:hypothetical protein
VSNTCSACAPAALRAEVGNHRLGGDLQQAVQGLRWFSAIALMRAKSLLPPPSTM